MDCQPSIINIEKHRELDTLGMLLPDKFAYSMSKLVYLPLHVVTCTKACTPAIY